MSRLWLQRLRLRRLRRLEHFLWWLWRFLGRLWLRRLLRIMGRLPLLLIQIMSKKPKIDHEYHDRKDKMKISIKGYSPNKRTRKAIIKKVSDTLKKSKPDRLAEYDARLTEVGD
jgi:hypothetical protein